MGGDRHSERPKARGEARDVAAHYWAEISVDYGSGQPFELAELRGDLMARADEGVRTLLLQDSFRLFFMSRSNEAVEEADRDGLHTFLAKLAARRTHRSRIECRLDLAGMADPLWRLEPQVTRHKRRRLVNEEIIEVRPLLTSDFEQVAEAFRGEKPRSDAFVLYEGVGCDRGAVSEVANRGSRPVACIGRHESHAFLYALCNAAGRILRCG